MITTGLVRLGRDAEIRYTTGGDPVANLSLAFNYGRKGEDGKRTTQWIDASLWGDRAVSLQQYLTKGTALVVVLEDVHVETYQKRDGAQGSKLVGRVTLLEFAGRPAEEKREAPPTPPAPARAPTTTSAPGSFNDFEDDIPF